MLKKIGLIGDVHARDDRLAAALEVLTDLDLDAILCTGDIMDGPGCPDRCIDLLKAHGVSTVRGIAFEVSQFSILNTGHTTIRVLSGRTSGDRSTMAL